MYKKEIIKMAKRKDKYNRIMEEIHGHNFNVRKSKVKHIKNSPIHPTLFLAILKQKKIRKPTYFCQCYEFLHFC